jgi:hypothetical protein
METARLRNYLYLFGLPLLWWGSVSLSGPLLNNPSPAKSLEFLPIALHASREADYGSDAYALTTAPIDLSIIKDALEDRADIILLNQIIVNNTKAQTPQPQKSEQNTEHSDEVVVINPSSNSESPPPPVTGGDGQTGDSGSDDNNTDSGTDGGSESDSPGNSADKGKGKDKDNNGQNNSNGNGNGSGSGNGKDKGNNSNNA